MEKIKSFCKKNISNIKNILKQMNYIFFAISIVHFIITFFTDRLLINYDKLNLSNYIFCKIILFFILTIFWQFIAKVFVKKDKELIKYVKYFLIYFIPVGIILLLVWPGVWFGTDVRNFLSLVQWCDFLYYLNYLTSIFYSIGCMLFPCASGAIILLTICFGIVAGYVVKRTFDVTNGKKIAYIMYIPFILLNTLFYTFFANRPIMVGIFYLLLISILIFDKIEKKELTNLKLCIIVILTGILATWRTENIYLIGAIPLFIFLGYRIKFNIKNLAKILLPILTFSLIVYIPQYMRYSTQKDMANRNLPIYVNPLSCMLNEELKGDKIDEAIGKIDKVLDVEILKQYPSYVETPVLWKEPSVIKSFTIEEFEEFKDAYNYIVKNNFKQFIKTKLLTFSMSSGIRNDYFSSRNLYSSNEETIDNYDFTKPIFDYRIRKNILSILEGRFGDDEISMLPYRLAFNLLLPLMFIGIMFIYSIIKKNLYGFLMCGMLLGHTFLVFITAPAGYFMYYFNIYICGWSLFILFIICKIKYKKKKLL